MMSNRDTNRPLLRMQAFQLKNTDATSRRGGVKREALRLHGAFTYHRIKEVSLVVEEVPTQRIGDNPLD